MDPESARVEDRVMENNGLVGSVGKVRTDVVELWPRGSVVGIREDSHVGVVWRRQRKRELCSSSVVL